MDLHPSTWSWVLLGGALVAIVQWIRPLDTLAKWFGAARLRWRFMPRIDDRRELCRHEQMYHNAAGHQTPGMTLRLWLYGCAGQVTSVQVMRVRRNNVLVDNVRSPLQWTHEDPEREAVRVGHRSEEGRYVDVGFCVAGRWQLRSRQEIAMGRWLTEPGNYLIALSVETEGGLRTEISVTVYFDGQPASFRFL